MTEPMIQLVPAERDAKAKQMYKFMNWFVRRHRKEINNDAKRAIWLLMAYGESGTKEWFDSFEEPR